MSTQSQLCNFFRTARSIGLLHHLQIWMAMQELLALHKSHRMRVNLCQLVYILSRQSAQHMRYAHLVLSYHRKIALAKKLVILQQTAGNRVFNRHRANQRTVGLQTIKHTAKRFTRHHVNILSRKICSCRSIMETSFYALYCYFFLHSVILNKKSRSMAGF